MAQHLDTPAIQNALSGPLQHARIVPVDSAAQGAATAQRSEKVTRLGVPEGSATITVDGVALAVASEGEGPALVCLHAIGHGGSDYAGLAQALKHRYRVIRIDWPGHGRSGDDPAPPTARRFAELLAGVLAELGVAEPVIVGCSIGGAAAMHYAEQHPVRALVLCNPAGLVPASPLVGRVCAAFTRFFLAGAHGASWFKPAFHAYYRFMVLPGPLARAQRERIIDAAYELAPGLHAAWSHFGEPAADIRHIARKLAMPVWFAWAEGDKVIQLGRSLPCIRQMPNAELSRFKGGHAAFLEQPEAFLHGLQHFLQRIEPGAAGH